MWRVDAEGNIYYDEGAARSDLSGDPRVGILNPASSLAQQILESRASGGGGVTAPPREAVESARETSVPPPAATTYSARGSRADAERLQAQADDFNAPPPTPLDLSGLMGALPTTSVDTGYAPSLVDTGFAESMLRLEQTPEEQAALDQLLQDLEFRAEAGATAVRGGFENVRAINAAAAEKSSRMAREAGPEAAQLWLDAANNVLNLSSQVADAFGNIAGMQSVNVSPTAGAGNISALLAAEAPRAQALAERMGLATAEEIAAQARTASMMGEAYAGEIQRTLLIEASRQRAAHNERVLNRIAQERQMVAEMRFGAAQTNAQLLSQAAAQAAAGGDTPESRRDRVRNLVTDVREFANVDPMDADPVNGVALLMGVYDFLDAASARALIEGARSGTLDWETAIAQIGG